MLHCRGKLARVVENITAFVGLGEWTSLLGRNIRPTSNICISRMTFLWRTRALFLLLLFTFMPAYSAVRENIEYARVGDLSLRMDVSIPEGEGPFPAVILVHGGGWIAGDRKSNVQPLFQPLAGAGFAWFSISYRLANDPLQFGVAIEDVESAVRYVRAHAPEYHVDPNRLALVGESAGAHLASMAALTGPPDTRVRAVVSFYGPTDLVTLAKTSQHVPVWLRDQVRGTPFEQILMAGLQQLSPLNHIGRDMPPFLLIHGTRDTLVPFQQSETFCAKAKAAGGSCELYPVANAGHGIRWWDNTAYQREMVRWLKIQLNGRVPEMAIPAQSSSTVSNAGPRH